MDQINSQIQSLRSLSSLRQDGDIIFSTTSLPSMQTERQLAERISELERQLAERQLTERISAIVERHINQFQRDFETELTELETEEPHGNLIAQIQVPESIDQSNENNSLTENLTAKKPVNQPLKNMSNRDS